MKNGSLIAFHGETRALYQHPPNRFARRILERQYSLRHRAGDNGGSGAGGRQLRRCGDLRAVQPGQPPRLQQTVAHSSSALSLTPRSAYSKSLHATLQSAHWQGDLTHLLCDIAWRNGADGVDACQSAAARATSWRCVRNRMMRSRIEYKLRHHLPWKTGV